MGTLNPFTSQEAIVIGFRSVKQMGICDFLWSGTLIYPRFAPCRCWHSLFINLVRIDSGVKIGGKEVHKYVQFLAKPGTEPGTLCFRSRPTVSISLPSVE